MRAISRKLERDLTRERLECVKRIRAIDVILPHCRITPADIIVMRNIITTVCETYEITEEEIKREGRDIDFIAARQIAMYLIRDLTKLSLNRVSKEFNKNTHGTVLHSVKVVKGLLDVDQSFREEVHQIQLKLDAKEITN